MVGKLGTGFDQAIATFLQEKRPHLELQKLKNSLPLLRFYALNHLASLSALIIDLLAVLLPLSMSD